MMDGVRMLPDRRPRFSLWIGGRPKSQRTRAPAWYVEAVQAEARKQVQGAPLGSSTIDVEIIFTTRGPVLDVDNVPKRILDLLKGIVYDNDAQIRAVKSIGLRLDHGFPKNSNEGQFASVTVCSPMVGHCHRTIRARLVSLSSNRLRPTNESPPGANTGSTKLRTSSSLLVYNHKAAGTNLVRWGSTQRRLRQNPQASDE